MKDFYEDFYDISVTNPLGGPELKELSDKFIFPKPWREEMGID